MRAAFSALSFVASALAISVTFPSQGSTWSATGPNTLTWTSVSSDPTTFRVVIVDPTQKIQTELAASVNTALHTLSVQAPSSGFPIGNNWTVDLMGTDQSGNPSGILAQSSTFNITSASINGIPGSSTLSASNAVPTTMSGIKTSTSAGAAATATGTNTVDSASANLNPTGTPSGAVGFFQVSSALVALAAAAHFVF